MTKTNTKPEKDGKESEINMKQKLIEKSDSEPEEFPEDFDFITLSWEDTLGKEVQSFWESFEEE